MSHGGFQLLSQLGTSWNVELQYGVGSRNDTQECTRILRAFEWHRDEKIRGYKDTLCHFEYGVVGSLVPFSEARNVGVQEHKDELRVSQALCDVLMCDERPSLRTS